jgi:hypothetical protein
MSRHPLYLASTRQPSSKPGAGGMVSHASGPRIFYPMQQSQLYLAWMTIMKRLLILLTLTLAIAGPAAARDSLESFLDNVNARAGANMQNFYATVSVQFDVSQARVRDIQQEVSEPSVAFMIFQLSEMSGKPPERVLQVYKHGRGIGKGWGMIAKELGIRPGSADFHALKRGDLVYGETGGPVRVHGKGRGHGNGNGNQGQGHAH